MLQPDRAHVGLWACGVGGTLPELRSRVCSNNLGGMSRWLIALCFGGSVVAFACNDETVEEVDSTVCYSGMRWVGEKRGSPEMFPGRDCVGCHIDNDGPPLAVGGTIYPYVLSNGSPGLLAQTGTDCYGLEGVTIRIEDGDGQPFDLVTNRAGNFFIEGNPDDFAKPFTAVINWTDGEGEQRTSPMGTRPSYGGCGRCHNPGLSEEDRINVDLEAGMTEDMLLSPTARIGLPGNGPGANGEETIEDELNAIGCADPSFDAANNRICQQLAAP
jgi:hypothetical protein